MPPKALLPNPCSNIEWRLRTQSEFLQSLNPCFNGRYSLRSYHWIYVTPGIGPRHNANRCTVFRLFDTKIQKNFYFLIKKQKKTIWSVIKNAGKHNEGKSYSVQVLVGISAVCLSIAISPLLFSVFWGIPFLMFLFRMILTCKIWKECSVPEIYLHYYCIRLCFQSLGRI